MSFRVSGWSGYICRLSPDLFDEQVSRNNYTLSNLQSLANDEDENENKLAQVETTENSSSVKFKVIGHRKERKRERS